MKAVLISIQPQLCGLIASGKKTIEVRKSAPKEVPFKAYIYMTATKERCRFWEYITAYQNNKGDILNGSQKVIGEFICDKVIKTCGWRLRGNTGWCAKRTEAEEKFPTLACLTIDEIVEYAGGEGSEVSGWHISDLKIYDKPKELGEFRKVCLNGKCSDCIYEECKITRPPQSWCYVEELQ